MTQSGGPQQQDEMAVHRRAAAAASAKGWLERAGHGLFRFRSLTPLLLLAVAVPLLWQSRGRASPLWLALGLVSCVLGQALRCWVLGQVRDGTSGQNEALIATALNQTGPYAHTRNPLYLGNLGITLGLALVAHDPWVLALTLLGFGLQYKAIIAVEEAFLTERFGNVYIDFTKRVPRFFPRLTAAPPEGAQVTPPFSWARVLRKEHNPVAAWALLAIFFAAADRVVPALRYGATLSWKGSGLEPYAAAGAVVLALWLGVKGWKHQWLGGGFVKDVKRRLGL
jgi:protein-S-isoprenylcysteine O-methyltransferase Ste14